MYVHLILYLGESGNDQSGNDQEAPPTVPHPLNLDLEEQEEKVVVPSESDVLDILSSAHALQSKVRARKNYDSLTIHDVVGSLILSRSVSREYNLLYRSLQCVVNIIWAALSEDALPSLLKLHVHVLASVPSLPAVNIQCFLPTHN